MLRGERLKDKRLAEYADVISGALQRNKLEHDVVCYRRMEFNPYEKYMVGEIIVEKQFISTSIVQSAALDKDFSMVFLVPKESKAAYIENISKYPKQREMLLDKGCKLRVLSKQEDSIILEVIP